MKYQLFTNASKNNRWLLFLIWIVWNEIDLFTLRVECFIFLNLYGHYVFRCESFLKNFLLIDTTDRSNISSDQKCFFIALSLYPPPSFFANTPFKIRMTLCAKDVPENIQHSVSNAMLIKKKPGFSWRTAFNNEWYY